MKSAAFKIAMGVLAAGLYTWQALVPVQPGASAKELSPEQIAALSAKVKSLIREDRYKDALEPAKTLVAAYPDSSIYLDRLATVYHFLERPKEEAEQWERYMSVDPTPEDACPHLDHAYATLHDAVAQRRAAERCLALDPRNPDLIFTLAHAQEMAGELKEAGELYARGVELAPNDSDVVIGLGRVRFHLGFTPEALALAERTLRVSPNNPDALLLLGMCRLSMGETALARTALEKGAAVADKYADIHFLLGRVDEAEHQAGAARAQYQRVLQLDPENRQARARLEGVNQ
jgi:tetratricopeptide (TPR) repeat protein